LTTPQRGGEKTIQASGVNHTIHTSGGNLKGFPIDAME